MPAAMARLSLSCLADGGRNVNWKHSAYEEFWVHKLSVNVCQVVFSLFMGLAWIFACVKDPDRMLIVLDTQMRNCKGILDGSFCFQTSTAAS